MICQRVNYVMPIGADFFRSIFLADVFRFTPINITGATAIFTIRKSQDGIIIGQSNCTINGIGGRIDISYTAANTELLDLTGIEEKPVEEYDAANDIYCEHFGFAAYYALEITYFGGIVERLSDGYLLLKTGGSI